MFPNPKDIRDNKTRNRVAAYLRLLTFIDGLNKGIPPKYKVRARLWIVQAARLADLLERNFAADLADQAMIVKVRLPWEPKPPRSPRPSRFLERSELELHT